MRTLHGCGAEAAPSAQLKPDVGLPRRAYNEDNSHLGSFPLLLSDLKSGQRATVRAVVPRGDRDPIAKRLGELGFVPGEPVRLVTRGPLGREPLLVQIGYTRFALRRPEAERVVIDADDSGD